MNPFEPLPGTQADRPHGWVPAELASGNRIVARAVDGLGLLMLQKLLIQLLSGLEPY
jgi:hypothetical protein